MSKSLQYFLAKNGEFKQLVDKMGGTTDDDYVDFSNMGYSFEICGFNTDTSKWELIDEPLEDILLKGSSIFSATDVLEQIFDEENYDDCEVPEEQGCCGKCHKDEKKITEYYHFIDEICSDSVQKFISDTIGAKTDMDSKGINYELVLYFTSNGGYRMSTNMLIDFVNNSDFIKKVVFTEQIASGGFIFFTKINKPIEILYGTVGMVHLQSSALESRDLIKNEYKTIIRQKQDKVTNEKDLEFYKSLGMTEKHLNMINKGLDVFLGTDELAELKTKSPSIIIRYD